MAYAICVGVLRSLWMIPTSPLVSFTYSRSALQPMTALPPFAILLTNIVSIG